MAVEVEVSHTPANQSGLAIGLRSCRRARKLPCRHPKQTPTTYCVPPKARTPNFGTLPLPTHPHHAHVQIFSCDRMRYRSRRDFPPNWCRPVYLDLPVNRGRQYLCSLQYLLPPPGPEPASMARGIGHSVNGNMPKHGCHRRVFPPLATLPSAHGAEMGKLSGSRHRPGTKPGSVGRVVSVTKWLLLRLSGPRQPATA